MVSDDELNGALVTIPGWLAEGAVNPTGLLLTGVLVWPGGSTGGRIKQFAHIQLRSATDSSTPAHR